MAKLLGSLTLGLILFVAILGSGADDGGASAVQACDSSYPFVCLPPGLSISCDVVGIPLVVIYDPSNGATDPYHLDPDFDGVGCEGF